MRPHSFNSDKYVSAIKRVFSREEECLFSSKQMLNVQTKVLRLSEIFGLSAFPSFDLTGISTVETRVSILDLFRWYMSKIYRNFQQFCGQKHNTQPRPYTRCPSYTQLGHITYIHSKNAFKTVLARSGTEINGFLCF